MSITERRDCSSILYEAINTHIIGLHLYFADAAAVHTSLSNPTLSAVRPGEVLSLAHEVSIYPSGTPQRRTWRVQVGAVPGFRTEGQLALAVGVVVVSWERDWQAERSSWLVQKAVTCRGKTGNRMRLFGDLSIIVLQRVVRRLTVAIVQEVCNELGTAA